MSSSLISSAKRAERAAHPKRAARRARRRVMLQGASRCQSRAGPESKATFLYAPPSGSMRYADVLEPSSGYIRIFDESGDQTHGKKSLIEGPVAMAGPLSSAGATRIC